MKVRAGLLAALLPGAFACAERPVVEFETSTFAKALRPDDPRAIEPRYDPDEVLESIVSPGGAFRIHFTREGDDAVPGADEPVPSYVSEVADVYDEALLHYETLGFLPPHSDEDYSDGIDPLFDVYLVDFFGRGDGQYRTDICWGSDPEVCAGHMRHENDFAGYGYANLREAHRIIGSHEFFHAVQAAYSSGEPGPISEGTAVWATESFDPALRDFEGFAAVYLGDTERSLDSDGGFDGWIYGAAIWFQFLSEAYGDDVIKEIWEGRGTDGRPELWLQTVDDVLQQHGTDFAQAFLRFSRWNLAIRSGAGEETYAGASNLPLVGFRAEQAPVDTGRLRIFPASMRVYSILAGNLSTARIEVVAPAEGAADDLYVVAGWRGTTWAPQIALAADGYIDVPRPAANVDTLWVAIVDPRLEGSSRRPVLCVGTPDEHAACAQDADPNRVPDAGVAVDAGVSPEADAGVSADSGVTTPTMNDASGCTAAGGELALWPLALLAFVRRRRTLA